MLHCMLLGTLLLVAAVLRSYKKYRMYGIKATAAVRQQQRSSIKYEIVRALFRS